MAAVLGCGFLSFGTPTLRFPKNAAKLNNLYVVNNFELEWLVSTHNLAGYRSFQFPPLGHVLSEVERQRRHCLPQDPANNPPLPYLTPPVLAGVGVSFGY